jgi:hypothetical protein
MITEEKIKKFRKMVRNGEPQGELIEKLRAEGYSEEEISKIFVAHAYDMRSWYLTFAILFLLVGLYIANKGLLFLVFSALMFLVYFRETERLKNTKVKKDKGQG